MDIQARVHAPAVDAFPSGPNRNIQIKIRDEPDAGVFHQIEFDARRDFKRAAGPNSFGYDHLPVDRSGGIKSHTKSVGIIVETIAYRSEILH
jgi:hypothetical protein